MSWKRIALLSLCLGLVRVGGAEGIEEKDDLGETVKLEKPAVRLISLAPSNTEMLYALGLGAQVVGVTEYCNFPPEAAEKPHVASYNSVNTELITAARPDLVFAIRGNDSEGLQSLKNLGIPVFALDIQTLDQMLEALQRLGRLTGAEKQAEALVDSLTQRLKDVTAGLSEDKPSVLWAHLADPIYTAGAGTFIDDVIQRAGGRNLGGQAPGSWPQISLETVVGWGPEVIVTTDGRAKPEVLEAELARLRQTDGWKSLPAVRQGRILFVEGDLLLRPGPRVIEALEMIRAYLAPKGP